MNMSSAHVLVLRTRDPLHTGGTIWKWSCGNIGVVVNNLSLSQMRQRNNAFCNEYFRDLFPHREINFSFLRSKGSHEYITET